MNQENDEILINRCKDDLEHFTTVYQLYFDDVYRYTFSILQNREECEDIVSMTFETALQKIQDFEYRGFSLKSWLFKIARMHLSNKFRLKRNTLNTEFDEGIISDISEDILIKVFDKDLLSRIENYIETMPDHVKEIFILRTWQEMEFNEIAEITGKSLSAVKMNYYRALEKVKEKFIEGGKYYA